MSLRRALHLAPMDIRRELAAPVCRSELLADLLRNAEGAVAMSRSLHGAPLSFTYCGHDRAPPSSPSWRPRTCAGRCTRRAPGTSPRPPSSRSGHRRRVSLTWPFLELLDLCLMAARGLPHLNCEPS